jgi:hypothetical protein
MMNFEYTLFHPKGEIKVKVTGATANAAMATVQMGHEIVAMMGGNVAGQAPVEITPEPAVAGEVDRGCFEGAADPVAAAFDTPVVAPQPEPEPEETEDGAATGRPISVDSAGAPFDPELHTGTLKKDGTWRLKKGAASKVEETESEEADEGEPEGNGSTSETSKSAENAAVFDSPQTTEEGSSTPAPTADEAEITDTELQRYCGRLVQHFGKSDPVFALAAEFVPDGEMPRPTMIKDQAQRRAFIAKAQEQTGVIFHG